MDDATIGSITAAIAVIGGLALVYGTFIGPRQMYLVQAAIDALNINSRYRPLLNFGIGILLAMVVSAFLAVYLDNWNVLIFGLVAGVFASNSAADEHDKTAAQVVPVVEATGQTVTTDPQADVAVANQQPVQRRLIS